MVEAWIELSKITMIVVLISIPIVAISSMIQKSQLEKLESNNKSK